MAIVPNDTFVVTSLGNSETLDSFIVPAGLVDGPSVSASMAGTDSGQGSALRLRNAVQLTDVYAELDGSASRITFDPSLSGNVDRLTESFLAQYGEQDGFYS